MLLNIIGAIAPFASYLKEHMGDPIDLGTVKAFSEMVAKIVKIVSEG
jgi:predicted nucleotidyltransferase